MNARTAWHDDAQHDPPVEHWAERLPHWVRVVALLVFAAAVAGLHLIA